MELRVQETMELHVPETMELRVPETMELRVQETMETPLSSCCHHAFCFLVTEVSLGKR